MKAILIRYIKYGRAALPFVVLLAAAYLAYGSLIARGPSGNLTHLAWNDLFHFMYPRLIFNSDSLRSLTFPLWNPYIYSGMPWASNPQTCLFHPICLIVILFFGYSLATLQIQLFVTFFLSGVSMYLCLRSFSCCRTASIIGGIIFLGCGFFTGSAQHFPQINTLACVPLIFMAVNKILARQTLSASAWGAFAIALLVFSGYPTMMANSLAMLFLFGIAKSGRSMASLGYLVAFFLLGLALSSVLLLPACENAMLSMRTTGASVTDLAITSLDPNYLVTMWFPYFASFNFQGHPMNPALSNCGIGLVGLFLAFYYLIACAGRLKWTLGTLLVLSAVLMLGTWTPAYMALRKFIPLIRYVSHPAMDYRALFLFFMCLIAGLGAQELISRRAKDSSRVMIVFAVFLISALAVFIYLRASFGEGVYKVTAGHIYFIASLMLGLAMVAASVRLSLSRASLCILLIVLSCFEIHYWVKADFSFNSTVTPVDDTIWASLKQQEAARPRNVRENAVFRRKIEQYPVEYDRNRAMFYKYFSDSGYDHALILKYYDDIMRSPAKALLTEEWRVMPIYEARIVDGEQDVLSAIQEGADLHRAALVNRRDIHDRQLLRALVNFSAREPRSFSARVVSYSPNSIVYEVNTDKPAILLFNEIYYPGWRLFEGGHRRELFRIDHAFRGAYIEEGVHRLRMIFMPLSFIIGFFISAASLALIFFLIRKNKKQLIR